MIHSVRLEQLPAELQLPHDLQGRFWFDAQRQQLCFDGFMSKATYDRLTQLSPDRHYQRGLNELFRATADVEIRRDPIRGGTVALALLGLAGLCGLALLMMRG